jgi:hypothetical protein
MPVAPRALATSAGRKTFVYAHAWLQFVELSVGIVACSYPIRRGSSGTDQMAANRGRDRTRVFGLIRADASMKPKIITAVPATIFDCLIGLGQTKTLKIRPRPEFSISRPLE